MYHLIVLLTIEAMLGLAWHRRPHVGPRVWLTALALTGGRGVLIVAALVARLASWPATALLPPLERCLDLAGLGVLAWALVPLWLKWRWADSFWGLAHPLAGLGIYLPWALYGSVGRAFNGSLPDALSSVWGVVLAGGGLVGMLAGARSPREANRDGASGYITAAWIFILAGYGLQVLFPDPAVPASGWTRWAFLVAYPLWVIAVYLRTAGPQERALLVPPDWSVWEACQAVLVNAGQPRRNEAFEQLAAAMAASLRVQVAAVGIPTAGPEMVEWFAARDSGEPLVSGRVLPLETQPAVQRAIARKQGFSPEPSSHEARALTAMWGQALPGRLWIEPLLHHRQTVGVLIAAKAQEAPAWSPAEIEQLGASAARLGSVLSLLRHWEDMARREQDGARQLHDLAAQWTQSKADAEARLEAVQAELGQVKAELGAARRQIAQYRQQVDDLAALVQLYENPAESEARK